MNGAGGAMPGRGPVAPPLLHVVLHEPEIPNNTGNIGRTCVATHCALHLIRPLGFDTSEKACRRAGLDYWPRLRPSEHDSFERYRDDCLGGGERAGSERVWLFTTRRGGSVFEAPFRPGDHLIFGKETRGLPEDLLDRYPDRCVRFPMARGERSLNLATAVCAAVYLALGRFEREGWIGVSAEGRLVVSGPADGGDGGAGPVGEGVTSAACDVHSAQP